MERNPFFTIDDKACLRDLAMYGTCVQRIRWEYGVAVKERVPLSSFFRDGYDGFCEKDTI